ncbi:hypothetical protein QTO34_006256 [Cnephaeus nilssonii]|uniref:Core shell protein Gag P30 domain-containing protein n=1 Tax=Cnephaeus nilssonii TaxID=3371016 RepID=A0AA40HN77_CNENI|nr:hypothetical protein QTO34_006256 [Eptesicus nilssonii]
MGRILRKWQILLPPFFVTHHPNWADVQALLNILLTTDERQLVIDRANEKVHQNPNGTPNPAGMIPLTEPNWEAHRGDLASLEHYRRCISEGLKKGFVRPTKSTLR